MFRNKSNVAEEVMGSIIWSLSNWVSHDKDFIDVPLHDLTCSWDAVFQRNGQIVKLQPLTGFLARHFEVEL